MFSVRQRICLQYFSITAKQYCVKFYQPLASYRLKPLVFKMVHLCLVCRCICVKAESAQQSQLCTGRPAADAALAVAWRCFLVQCTVCACVTVHLCIVCLSVRLSEDHVRRAMPRFGGYAWQDDAQDHPNWTKLWGMCTCQHAVDRCIGMCRTIQSSLRAC